MTATVAIQFHRIFLSRLDNLARSSGTRGPKRAIPEPECERGQPIGWRITQRKPMWLVEVSIASG